MPLEAHLANDAGPSNTDGFTNDATITGIAPANATIAFTEGSNNYGTTRANAQGVFTYRPTLANGPHTISLTSTDGSQTDTASVSLTLGGSPFTVSLRNNGPLTYTKTSVELFVTGAPSSATLSLSDFSAGVTTDGNGHFFVSQQNPYSVRVNDLYGDYATATTIVSANLTIPTAPSRPVLGFSSDTGLVGDSITKITKPTITISGVVNGTVKLYDTDGSELASGTATGGTVNLTPTTDLAEGSHTLTAKVTAADNGGVSNASLGLGITIDTTSPSVPGIPTLSAGSDTGVSDHDAVTRNATPTITGTAEADSAIKLFDTDGATVLGSTTADGSGNWSIISSALADGSHTLTVRATDAAGNVSVASSGSAIVVDTQNPAVAFTSQGGVVYAAAQMIAGTVTDAHSIGTTVTLKEGSTTLGTAIVQANGTWATTINLGTFGAHTIVASDADLAGNTGQAQLSLTLAEAAVPNDPAIAGSVSVGPGQTQTLSGLTSGSLTVDGGGTLLLTGTNTYTGPTTVSAGTLLIDGSIVSPVTVQSGATLGGHGSTGTVTIASGGTLSPGNSPGVLATKDLSLATGASLKEEIGGTGAGQYDQTKVVGTVSLNGATLTLAGYQGFVSKRGDAFTLIDNDGTDAVQGTFAGLAEGGTLSLGTHAYQISYRGGDGNDVVLRDVTLPPAATLALFGSVVTSPASQTGAVYGLYQGVLGRAPDALGLEGFSASLQTGASLTDVAGAILGSAERGAQPANPTSFVTGLYANLLHRAPDAGGLQFFTAELAQGVSQATVAVQLATSTEAQANLVTTFQVGVVVPDAIDSAVARLYYGLLNRAPDAGGLGGFEGQVKQAAVAGGYAGALQGLSNVANAMLGSSEFAATHAGQTSAAYVDSLYVGALGRHADAAGASYFGAELAQGVSRATVALQIAESAEAQVHLVGVIEQGFQLVA